MSYFFHKNRVYFTQNNNGRITMSIIAPLPVKFECGNCHQIYMHLEQGGGLYQYPCCPQCAAQGRLLGSAEVIDLIVHPVLVAKSYLHATLQMLGKTH